MKKLLRTLFSIAIIIQIILPLPVLAQEDTVFSVEAPETIEEAQEFGLNILKEIPDAVTVVWETQALPLWSKMWGITKNIWDTTVSSWLKGLRDQVLSFLGQEIEKRRPLIEEEFQREKEELKQELQERIPDPKKTLWNLLKGFLPGNEAE